MSAFIEKRVPGVVLNVHNLEKSAEWYKEKLGFEIGPHDYYSYVEMFIDGEYIFHLGPASEQTLPISTPIFWFYSNDIELAYLELQSMGVRVDEMSWFPDYSAFTFYDFDGNAVSIMQKFKIRFKELDAFRLVGIKVDKSENAIPKAAHELKKRLIEIPYVVQANQMIGVRIIGESSSAGDSSPAAATDYWVCVAVSQAAEIPQGMEAVTIAAQQYAVNWYYGLRTF